MAKPNYFRENLVLFGALAANLGIAVAKFIAAGITGSSAMLSEGFHSVVDSLNQVLLLYGKHRSGKPPNRKHPFGYGRELYFWAFVVAILVFAVGAGLSFYEGLTHWRRPEPLRDPTVNYIVLGIAIILEGTSWTIALREFLAAKGDQGIWSEFRRSKDPSVFVVLFEDTAALAGLIVAAVGVWASHVFDAPRIDGMASMVIGGILAMVAALLAREAKSLLIGESADTELVGKIRDLVEAKDWVTGVNHVRTIHTSPREIFVAISADLEDHITIGEGEKFIEALETELRTEIPELSSIYVRPEAREDAARLTSD
ncbi:cation diffusion facilitator family transporter [Qipengyuania sp. YG27]|uniref:Cation diffusion facilitator family transporter n=1 Tax=Qipengyuania mesophila TaxID=2867246 RepID=A0ABS7JRZ7_9SPHN|nr:cation diffusion facilitator family transporter [Qipengyuania mesophila]MBX7500411.1 cation diffusion facilitator family transporter [Qipengyuania mesophila]